MVSEHDCDYHKREILERPSVSILGLGAKEVSNFFARRLKVHVGIQICKANHAQ